MNKKEEQIKENYVLLHEIKAIPISIKIEEENKRDILFIGFFSTALSHYQSITVLIEEGLDHSALALMRVLFENIVRGLYMYNEFDNEKVKKLYQSKNWDDKQFFKIQMSIMCETIDREYGNKYGEISFKKTKEKVFSSMCDYTHTGASQITRSFNDLTLAIEPSFSDELILSVLTDSNILMNVFSAMCLDHLNIDEMEN